MAWVNSFEDCISACEAAEGCVDVSFLWPNACYMKNTLNTASDNDAVWTARKQTSTSTGGSGGASTLATSPTCDNNASHGTTYATAIGNFYIECATDYGYLSL
jgi:hypothetical protein